MPLKLVYNPYLLKTCWENMEILFWYLNFRWYLQKKSTTTKYVNNIWVCECLPFFFLDPSFVDRMTKKNRCIFCLSILYWSLFMLDMVDFERILLHRMNVTKWNTFIQKCHWNWLNCSRHTHTHTHAHNKELAEIFQPKI